MSKSKHLKRPYAKSSIAVFPCLLRLLLRVLHKYPSISEFVRTGAQSHNAGHIHIHVQNQAVGMFKTLKYSL